MGTGTAGQTKVMAALELQRRRLVELACSSKRLERLTWTPMCLTAVLTILTLILAVPEFGRLIECFRAR